MIDLKYSMVIEATEDPNFFGFYSPDLSGFTGVGKSVQDCLDQARPAMDEFIQFLTDKDMPIPKPKGRPKVTIVNTPKSMAEA